MKELPSNTVARLSQYKRHLLKYRYLERPYIFSHDLARALNHKAVVIRRDLMLLGFTGSHKNGYNVKELIQRITEALSAGTPKNVAFVGLGNLGKALINYFSGEDSFLNITAAFDIDPLKVNKSYSGIYCYPINKMAEVVKEKSISIGVILVPPDDAQDIAELMVLNGIQGILNFTSSVIKVDDKVFVEDVDFITALEKLSYFCRCTE
jgi:redox-sensing transcriptional repressor